MQNYWASFYLVNWSIELLSWRECLNFVCLPLCFWTQVISNVHRVGSGEGPCRCGFPSSRTHQWLIVGLWTLPTRAWVLMGPMQAVAVLTRGFPSLLFVFWLCVLWVCSSMLLSKPWRGWMNIPLRAQHWTMPYSHILSNSVFVFIARKCLRLSASVSVNKCWRPQCDTR